MIQSGDSSFTWVNKGPLYNAPAQGRFLALEFPFGRHCQSLSLTRRPGHCLHFPDLDGNRRADMHFVDAVENSAETWFNTCPNGSGDDADTLTSPALPSPP